LDCRAANHDAINQVANAGSRSGAVGGQLSDGVSDERFDIGGGNADDWGVFTFYMWVGWGASRLAETSGCRPVESFEVANACHENGFSGVSVMRPGPCVRG